MVLVFTVEVAVGREVAVVPVLVPVVAVPSFDNVSAMIILLKSRRTHRETLRVERILECACTSRDTCLEAKY